MEKPLTVVVQGDEIRFVHDDATAAAFDGVGVFDVRRASTVEPTTRRGRLLWVANLGPVRGPLCAFYGRQEALAWEREQLEEMNVPKPDGVPPCGRG